MSKLPCAAALLCCLAATALTHAATLTPAGQMTVTSYEWANRQIPSWSGGALVAVETRYDPKDRMPVPGYSPIIHVFDSQGHEASSVTLTLPDAARTWLRGSAHAADGEIAMVGSFTDSAGKVSSYIALATPAGKIEKLFSTDPYYATAVTFAPDGTFWTKGTAVTGPSRKPAKTTAGVLRHWDRSGTQLGDFVPQSSLTTTELFLGVDHLTATATRVAWYLSRGSKFYFEVSADGAVHQFPVLPIEETNYDVAGLALTDRGDVFIAKTSHGAHPALFTLDRQTQSWTPVPFPSPWLMGANGNTLVFRGNSGTFQFFAVAPN